MSTSLQRDFFSQHPEIDFLGWGRPGQEHGWVDDEFAALCEVGIRYEKSLAYNNQWADKIFAKHVKTFQANGSKRLLCLSCESFSFTMHFDVDPTIKAQRLKRLMGVGTKILIVTRNQLSLFRSYYFECVRGGYSGQFAEFLNFNYHYLFHSILGDLQYHKIYQLYCKLFGTDNVKVIPMEALAMNSTQELSALCRFAGISDIPSSLSRHNDSSDKRYLQAVRLMNEKFPNNRGTGYFGWVDGDKLIPYWHSVLKVSTPAAASHNDGLRMLVYRSAQDVVCDFVSDLEAEYSEEWMVRLNELYRRDNADLAEATGIDFKAFGYALP